MKETLVGVLALTAALALLGCGAHQDATTTAEPEQAAAVEPVAEPVEETVADDAEILAMADGADGALDNVVGKCAVCGLAMDGSAEHASYYKEYTFHLCSSECKESFDHDPVVVVARLEAPVEE